MLQPHFKFNDENKTGIKIISGALLASLLLLSACGGSSTTKTGDSTTSSGGDSSTSGNGGTSSGSGSASCTDIAGEPDIMGAITYTPATAKPGDTVIMHVPVDAETAVITATLAGFSGGSVVGVATAPDTVVSTSKAQTIDVSITIPTLSGAGDYYLTMNICSSGINACNKVTNSPGVAVNFASNPVVKNVPLTQFKYFANGSEIKPSVTNLPVNSCVTQPILTVAP